MLEPALRAALGPLLGPAGALVRPVPPLAPCAGRVNHPGETIAGPCRRGAERSSRVPVPAPLCSTPAR